MALLLPPCAHADPAAKVCLQRWIFNHDVDKCIYPWFWSYQMPESSQPGCHGLTCWHGGETTEKNSLWLTTVWIKCRISLEEVENPSQIKPCRGAAKATRVRTERRRPVIIVLVYDLGLFRWSVKALFHSIGRPVRLAVCVWFGISAWIWGPFPLQTNPLDARSRITLEPINGAEPVFPEMATILCS